MLVRSLLCALALLTANSLLAQTPAPSTPAPPQAEIRAYYLGPEDVLSITVVNFPNLSVPQMVVPPDGSITVSLLEPISILGKTTNEVAQTLTTKWKKYVINPSVTVTLVSKRRESVLIYGFISRTGQVEFKPGKRLLEAITEAGGASPQADLSHVTISRKSGTKQVLDLSHPETKSNTEANIVLEVGDLIYLPERRVQISIVGEVGKPGSFDYKDDMTVLDALAAAGGVRESADLAEATILHDEVEKKLDLEALLRRGDLSVNIKMSAGDRIVIPEIRNRTYVFGAVGRPGFYLFKAGDRILDALNGCGGPNREAELRKVNHIRIDRKTNKAVVTAINVDQFLKKGDLKANLALEPGDVIFIPDRRKPFAVQDLFGILTGINIFDRLGGILGIR